MRDDSYLDSGTEAQTAPPKWRSHAATGVGALISVAILTGVVIWSYRLGVRDAAEIPVIRAELGATKVRPEEPGGLEVEYQGRAIYGVVSGAEDGAGATTGYAEPPEGLAEEDVAAVALSPTPAPRPSAPAEVVVASPEPAPEPAAAAPAPAAAAPEANGEPEAPALEAEPAPAPAAESEPAAPTAVAEAEPDPEAGAETEDAAAAGEEDVASLAPAAAPPARPRPQRAAPAAATPAAAQPEPREAAASSRVQIQLGAFVSAEVAAEQWAAIKGRNGDLLSGRGRVITPVQSGGRRLWRLRAGPFADVSEASSLCRGLKARNEACIVARKEN